MSSSASATALYRCRPDELFSYPVVCVLLFFSRLRSWPRVWIFLFSCILGAWWLLGQPRIVLFQRVALHCWFLPWFSASDPPPGPLRVRCFPIDGDCFRPPLLYQLLPRLFPHSSSFRICPSVQCLRRWFRVFCSVLSAVLLASIRSRHLLPPPFAHHRWLVCLYRSGDSRSIPSRLLWLHPL